VAPRTKVQVGRWLENNSQKKITWLGTGEEPCELGFLRLSWEREQGPRWSVRRARCMGELKRTVERPGTGMGRGCSGSKLRLSCVAAGSLARLARLGGSPVRAGWDSC